MSSLPLGTKLQNGAFTIGKVLGQGGFGITYHGSDTRLNRLVAIKEFFPLGCTRDGREVCSHGLLDDASYGAAKAKFLQEAQSLAQFRHAGIVHIYTFCEENNTAYLVMEFLRGQTLTQLMESRGALPESEAVEIIEKVGAAVEELHRNKTLHRDIKPDNVVVCDDGRVVLIDFGLSKKIEESVGSSTRQLSTTAAFGSDGFAPPEQYLKSGIVGTYTDVYALGATLYFLLTGKIPPSAMERLAGEELTPPETLKQVSQNVNNAVMNAMELKSERRFREPTKFIDFALQISKTRIGSGNATHQVTLAQKASSRSRGMTPNEAVRAECQNISTVCPLCELKNYLTISIRIGEVIICCRCEKTFKVATIDESAKRIKSVQQIVPTVTGGASSSIIRVGAVRCFMKIDPSQGQTPSNFIHTVGIDIEEEYEDIFLFVTPEDDQKPPTLVVMNEENIAQLKLLLRRAEEVLEYIKSKKR